MDKTLSKGLSGGNLGGKVGGCQFIAKEKLTVRMFKLWGLIRSDDRQ